MRYPIEREDIFELCQNLGEGSNTKGYLNIDRYKAKANYVTRIIDNAEAINELYQALYNSDLAQIERTKCGAIAKHNIHHAGGAYDVQEITTAKGFFKGIIITVLLFNKIFVFKCGMFTTKDKRYNGSKAFKMFCSEAKKNGKDITQYRIDNGLEVKESISKVKIGFEREYKLKRVQGVNHIDLNCAWGTGFVEAFPEFEQEVLALKNKDKVLPSMFLGYCQSEYAGYKYSHFAKAGIDWCNKKLEEITAKLTAQGYKVIGYNTDGIWYIDSTNKGRVYHDDGEHDGLGGWKTDYTNCELCAYSDGQYWFKCDGKFNVRARGWYSYEEEKPRDEWDEYDFDKAMRCETSINFIKGRGFIVHRCRND